MKTSFLRPWLACNFGLIPLIAACSLGRAESFSGSNNPASGSDFNFTVPGGATNFTVVVTNSPTAYSHLYLKRGSPATESDYDFAARLDGQNNAIALELPEVQPDTWHVRVSTPANSLTHAFSVGVETDQTDLRSANRPTSKPRVSSTDGSLSAGTWHYFQVDVGSGLPGWVLVLNTLTAADPQLYVRRGALPTEALWDQASTNRSSDAVYLNGGALQAGTYYVGVFLPQSATGQGRYTLQSALGTFTALTWDPGTTHDGTQVHTNISGVGGNHFFRVTTQNTSVGAWRTALNVLASEADVYLQKGLLPSTNSYSLKSDRVGADGFVIPSTGFQSSEEWYVLVRAEAGAQWSLLSGEAFVQDLGELAAVDSTGSDSGDVTIGPEGIRFFRTSMPTTLFAWRLWLNGQNNDILVKKLSVPVPGQWDLSRAGQMLVVPNYLVPGGESYFVGVPGLPGTKVNLYSRQHPYEDLAFTSSSNLTVAGYPYRTFRVQVPVEQIAWQINVTPSSGNPNVAVRRELMPNEDHNSAFSEAAGTVADSIALSPPTLSDGTFYITVYGTGDYSCTLSSGLPTVTDINYVDFRINDEVNRVGWRYYRVANLSQQIGTLGWELLLTNAPTGAEIALRRNGVPYRFTSRNGGPYAGSGGDVDYSSLTGFLQRPAHEADVWYVGIYSPGEALGGFELTTRQLVPPTVTFNGGTVAVEDQTLGAWLFYRVDVPVGVAGWDLRLVSVTAGAPQLVVRRDRLPVSLYHEPSGVVPWSNSGTNWPSGNQLPADADWHASYRAADGTYEFGRALVMGMTNVLEPGTYYVGVFNATSFYYGPNNANTAAYTLQSRGIGTGQAIPITDVAFAGGSATNGSLAVRDTAYYRVAVPANAVGWKVRLRAVSGEVMLKVRTRLLPHSGRDGYYNSPGDNYGSTHHGGFTLRKTGNEHYVLLPPEGQTSLPAGHHYLAVVGEGVGPQPDLYQVGTGYASYELTSVGEIPVADLGTLSTTETVLTNAIEGGELAAYRFTVPANAPSVELRLEDRVGNPVMAVRPGLEFPRRSIGSFEDYYGVEGGNDSDCTADASIITLANPAEGTYSLLVKANRSVNNQIPDAGYTLKLRVVPPPLVPFDGGNAVITGQPVGAWRFFQVNVPEGALGWDIRLVSVTNGAPRLVVRRDLLPFNSDFFPYSGFIPWPSYGTNWPSGNQWPAGDDWHASLYAADGTSEFGRTLVVGLTNILEPGTYYVGVYNHAAFYNGPNNSNPAAYTLQSRGIGSGLTVPVTALSFAGGSVSSNGLPVREVAYFRVDVPADTLGWKVRLQATTGDVMLKVRQGVLPNNHRDAYYGSPGSNHGQPHNGGFTLRKTGNEHYVLLPQNGQTSLVPGPYYLAVVSEGVGALPDQQRVGAGNANFTLTSQGALPIVNLGTVSTTASVHANTLEGGELAAYQFSVPPSAASVEMRLEDRVGDPLMLLRPGTGFPARTYLFDDGYGLEGGQDSGRAGDAAIITLANPAEGVHSLIVKANRNQNGQIADASYTLRVRVVPPPPLTFDGGSVVVTDQPVGAWRFFQVNVPEGALGWDLRLVNVTNGAPRLVVRRDLLPFSSDFYPYSGFIPWAGYGTNWPSSNQWPAGAHWHSAYLAADGTNEYGRALAVGMTNILEPGTYYVGVFNGTAFYNGPVNTNAAAYRLQSRGIGSGLALPVTDMAFAGGSVTNEALGVREAAYYRVIVPANMAGWKVRLQATGGEVMLKVRLGRVPSSLRDEWYGGPGNNYNITGGYSHVGGFSIRKAGNEHYVLLPQNGQANLIAGEYYLAVVGEGVGAQPEALKVGTGSVSYALTNEGALPVANLGTLSTTETVLTNALEGGELAAYQFNVPAGAASVELRLEDRVGNPMMALRPGTGFPSRFDDGYGHEGGQDDGRLVDPAILTLPNVGIGIHSLLVKASRAQNGQVPDADYSLKARILTVPELNFSSALNTNGMTNAVSATLQDRQRFYYKIIVPATNAGLPVIGWKLDLNVSQGSAQVRVRKDLLPNDDYYSGTSPYNSPQAVIVPPYLTNGTWYVEVLGTGSTTYTLTSSAVAPERLAWVMPQIGQANTTPGLSGREFGDSGVDPEGNPLPDDQGLFLDNGRFHFYAVTVPTNTLNVLRVALEAISGNPNLYVRVGLPPTLSHDPSGRGGTLYERAMSGTETEYANWVPLNGRNEHELAPGTWYLGIRAMDNSNARYRLRVSLPDIQDLNHAGGAYLNQSLADGDMRFYRVQLPYDPPASWNVTFSQISGDVVMFVRDSLPPGNGTALDDYLVLHWGSDYKNNGPYPTYDSSGTHNLPYPPLRPGQTYYLGFKARTGATFQLSSDYQPGPAGVPPTIDFYGGRVTNTLPVGGSALYRINVPPEATRWMSYVTNAGGVRFFLEQGTTPLTGYYQQHLATGVPNVIINQYLLNPNGWPWVPGQSYFLLATNTSAGEQTFIFVMDGRNALTDDADNDGLPDAWERQYFGSNIYLQYGDGDADGDGVTNIEEYREGTDPTNSLSLRPRLVVNAVNGSVTRDPDQTNYTRNTSVALTAAASPGFRFRGWTGAFTHTDNPTTVVLTSNVTVTAVFSPANDHFTERFALLGALVSTNSSTVGATREPGEPDHSSYAGGASVWWTWTAPATGSVTNDTLGSDFYTLLAVYTGNDLNNLTVVASNSFGGANGTSYLVFEAVAGTTYQIAVDGYNSATGNILLNISMNPYIGPLLTSPMMVQPGQFRFGFGSVNGQTYIIDASTTLTNWTPIATNVGPGGDFQITDTNAVLFPYRFYRVRQP